VKKIFLIMFLCLLCIRSALAANVSVDGVAFDGAKLIDSVTYVPIRSFSERMSECSVLWDGQSSAAKVLNEDIKLSAKISDPYIECNGRYIYAGAKNTLVDGKTYIPIRSLAKVFDASVIWNNATRTAEVTSDVEKFKSANEYYNQDDLYWLSKIINAESEGESLAGKIAVGNVVLNRVESADFPNTVYDVIFDRKGGVQFTPVANGSINKEPNEESVIAAKICLENYKVSNKNILFFLNPAISTSTWVPNNRDFIMTIGSHDFYA